MAISEGLVRVCIGRGYALKDAPHQLIGRTARLGSGWAKEPLHKLLRRSARLPRELMQRFPNAWQYQNT